MATETNQQNENKSPARVKAWLGSFRDGKFWCDCAPACRPKCLTSTQDWSKGKRFWRCPKNDNDPKKCHFFVWVEEEDEAKAWLAKYGPQEAPKTPSKKTNSPKSFVTPWTIAKKPVSREVSDKNENGGSLDRMDDDCDLSDGGDEGVESPSRRAAKRRRRYSTPNGQPFNKNLGEAALLLTPDTLDKGKGKAIGTTPILAEKISPTPSSSNGVPNPGRGRMEDLTTKVLKLLRDEKVELKGSTELQLGHEIDLELDLNATKLRRYEETILKQSQRIDELETMVELLTAGGTLDDPIELSD